MLRLVLHPAPAQVDLLAVNLSEDMPVALRFRDNLLREAGGYSILGQHHPTSDTANQSTIAPTPAPRKFLPLNSSTSDNKVDSRILTCPAEAPQKNPEGSPGSR